MTTCGEAVTNISEAGEKMIKGAVKETADVVRESKDVA